MYQYSENKWVFSRRLKLSVLSVGSRRSSLSEFQAAAGQQQQMPDADTSWGYLLSFAYFSLNFCFGH